MPSATMTAIVDSTTKARTMIAKMSMKDTDFLPLSHAHLDRCGKSSPGERIGQSTGDGRARTVDNDQSLVHGSAGGEATVKQRLQDEIAGDKHRLARRRAVDMELHGDSV